jgi:ABC-type Fe3+ transport system permease subunit
VLPPLWPVIAAGVATTFAHAFVDFGVPEALRAWPTLPTEVYTQLGVYYDPGAGARVAMVSAGGAALVICLALVLLRRVLPAFASATASDDHDPADDRGAAPALARAAGGSRFAGWRLLAAATLALPIVLLLFSLLRSSLEGGGIANWRAAWITGYPEVLKSTALAAACAFATTLLGGALGEAVARLRARGSLVFVVLLAAPMLMPGPVAAAAWLDVLSRVGAAGYASGAPAPLRLLGALADLLRDTPLALLTVWTLRWMPLVALFYCVGRRRVPAAWMEAARLEGVSGWRLWNLCLRPWVVAPAIAGGAVVWALAWGEAGSAILLLPPGTPTLSVRILTLLHFAPTTTMTSLALIGIAAGFCGLAAAIALLARTPRIRATPPAPHE